MRRLATVAALATMLSCAALPALAAKDRPRWEVRVLALVGEPGFPARAYVAPNGRIYEGTYENPLGGHQPSRVREYTGDGTLLRSWSVPGQNLSGGQGVQVATSDARGSLVLLDRDPARVLLLNPRKHKHRFRPYASFPDLEPCQPGATAPGCSPTIGDEPAVPNYAAWGRDGALYVTDYLQAVIWRVPAGGGKPRIWLADHRLDGDQFGTTGIVLEPDHRTLLVMQQSSAGGGNANPTTGKLYEVRIRRHHRPGEPQRIWESQPADGPDGFAVARSGRIYVALAGSNQIAVIGPDGSELERFPEIPQTGENGSPVPFDTPSSAMFKSTRLIVATRPSSAAIRPTRRFSTSRPASAGSRSSSRSAPDFAASDPRASLDGERVRRVPAPIGSGPGSFRTRQLASWRMERGAAFFDLDRTLMAGSSGMHFARAAYGSGIVSRRQLMRWGVEHVHFRLRGATDAQTSQLLSQVKELLEGVPARDIERLAPGLLAGVLPRIYPQMLDEVRNHQDADRPTFIVSAAGNDLVEVLARVLGMDGGIGTRYEVDGSGLLTGRIVEPFVYAEGKVAAMRGFAREHDIDLGASWAYSDSVSDLPMLRAVGTPVAVNPDAELAAVAAKEGWRVMRFERLGRQLAIAGATLVAAAVGGTGTVLARRRPERRGYRASLRR